MSGRYKRLYSLPAPLYAAGAPVFIAAGALLKDNQTGNVLAQLKLHSISDTPIKAVTVTVQPQDVTEEPLGDPLDHQYLDLAVKRDGDFGAKQAIPLPDRETRAFSVQVQRVIFADKSQWNADGALWEPLPDAAALSSAIADRELQKQYRLHFGKGSDYAYTVHKDLWYCTCGALNRTGEEKCHECGKAAAALAGLDMAKLIADKDARLAEEAAEEEARLKREQLRLEEQRRQEEEARQRAQAQAARKRKNIRLAAAITAVLLLCVIGAGAFLWYNSPAAVFEYTLYNSGKAEITGIRNADRAVADGVLTIPEAVPDFLNKQYAVTRIAANAVQDDSVRTVSLPVAVESIRTDAFSGCTGLQEIRYAGSADDWRQISGSDGLEGLQIAHQGDCTYGEFQLRTGYVCTAGGWYDRVCAVCDAVDSKEAEIRAHDLKVTAAKAATCTEAGHTEYQECSFCGTVNMALQEIPATGHTPAADKAKAATCTKDGLTAGSHCSVCSAVLEKQETVAKLGHSYGDWKRTKAPTCTEKGTDTRTCTRCGGKETRSVASLGGHTYSDWTRTKEPTCTATGTDTRTCTRCGGKETRSVASLGGHTYNSTVLKAATCTTSGSERLICTRCGVTETKEITALGHAYSGAYCTRCEIWIPDRTVGSTVKFGRYEQDNNLTNGTEEIEWIILASEEDRVLLISKDTLEYMQYNSNGPAYGDSLSWETCTLRSWMNGIFLNTAFSKDEQAKIMPASLTNPGGVRLNKIGPYGSKYQTTRTDNDTTDRIFALSASEVMQYFTRISDRVSQPTAYVKTLGLSISSSGGSWWLRSIADYGSPCLIYVGEYLNPGDFTASSADNRNGIRPAFWFNLKP